MALSADIDTIIDAAKTISSEIVPEELLKKTMTIILEHAGAQKGVLILNEKDTGTWKIEALGYVEQNNIKIALSHYDLSDKILPVTIINSVINNNKIITLNDAQANSYYGSNPYVKEHKIKSLVAIPVLKQASTVGILYLENNLNKNLFTQDRVNVLSILCTQLAISLENAQLYNTLEQKVRQRTQEVIKQKEEIQQQATMLETVNKELKTLNHTKDKLFSIIGHDLRNPFNIILGQSDLLIENLDEMDSKDTKKSLKFIENASKDAFQLLQNLLDWSRAQTGQLNFYPRKINLKQTIERDISLQENMAQTKNIELIKNIPSQLNIYADPDMVSTITRNLLSNALKFTSEGGNVVLEAQKSEKFVNIAIQDNGTGIKKEHIAILFSEDETYTTRGTNSEKGIGLGLKLCKDFITQNGGKISVESEYGRGTKFSFTLPLADQERE
ncbi:Non-motile and phage-resistance protein [Salinivirga cyanobacteriivorans]|uniref:histidine kinase n=1 Tax=Salinivirga cyanobacteriivorans TaxID=1307839 RepID=A0A0S2I4Q2_9BACT|nr:GAF domain-containing sensor histidine kinase [Salinivirga cyanobacteriivorans]ALO17327.1 Non-motile and phage-resistance protein [Salinivirga cyanobacteriivorans]